MSSRRRCGSSSSGEEDENEELKAAIDDSISANNSTSATIGGASADVDKPLPPRIEDELDCKSRTQLPKHYQSKAQKLLADILENNSVMVRDPIGIPDIGKEGDEGGIRLFKMAPPRILFDHCGEPEGPKKKPRILPGYEIDEKSKEFIWIICCCVIDISDVVTTAADACKKSIARMEAKDAAAKAAANREEQRVAELRKSRGERWLPSIAREMRQQSR